MDKKTIPIIVLLFLAMFMWPKIDKKYIKPRFPSPPAPVVSSEETTTNAVAITSEQPPHIEAAPAEVITPVEPTPEPEKPAVPEELWTLQNEHVVISISSYGAAIKNVTLNDYAELNEPESPNIQLNFEARPALQYRDIPDLSGFAAFTYSSQTTNSLTLTRKASSGLQLTRTITLVNDYELLVNDQFHNNASTPITNKHVSIQLGTMEKLPGKSMRGLVTLGIDALTPQQPLPIKYGKKLKGYFKEQQDASKLFPRSMERTELLPVDWVAVKNKYFTQILMPENGGNGCTIFAQRELSKQEKENPAVGSKILTAYEKIGAGILLPEMIIQPNSTFEQKLHYYVGPKKHAVLAAMGHQRESIMEFATTMPVFRSLNFAMVPIKKTLLWLLNFIHDHLWPFNYGIAIILITVLIRIIFWPITHKSTESMRRMQELKPLIDELKIKYKNEPQKMQQAQMALYKEHKINPLGGCLPMLIQIPVFIALFTVLRNAVELRFAPFLWVADLSMPENLLAGVLPIPLNILPLLMVITQFLQQKLTPTAGDPQQAKMMQFLPLMFLFMFYNMPSGLVLYWTTNQCLMIIQQLYTRRKQAQKEATV